MPYKLQFIPPESNHPINLEFSESYKRKLKIYERNYLKILEPETHEKAQMIHYANKSISKPEHIVTKLVSICRTKLNGANFEDSDSNLVSGSNSPKEGLSYILWEMVADEKSIAQGNPPDAFPLSTNTWIEGC